jgi:uncharacterized membrane protein
MKIGAPVAILGVILTVLGVTFHFQGQSIIGPESSFMYKNPEWITYGMQIAITGAIIMISGIIFKFIKRN